MFKDSITLYKWVTLAAKYSYKTVKFQTRIPKILSITKTKCIFNNIYTRQYDIPKQYVP